VNGKPAENDTKDAQFNRIVKAMNAWASSADTGANDSESLSNKVRAWSSVQELRAAGVLGSKLHPTGRLTLLLTRRARLAARNR
jgi:hypothetical protein